MRTRHARAPHARLARLVFRTVASFSLAGLPAHAHGQEGDAARLRSMLEGLSGGTRVEITAPGLWIEDGRLQGVGADSVRVVENGFVVPIGLTEIESVAVERDRLLFGVVGGAAAGALVGSAFGIMAGSFGCSTPFECNQLGRSRARQGALLVGVVGAIAGGLYGRSLVSWHPIFP